MSDGMYSDDGELAIEHLQAVEILDSRARPTLGVTIRLRDGATAWAGVPSGASTGSREAVEVRDGDPARFGGAGVLRAVRAVNEEIAAVLTSRSFTGTAELDSVLIDLDGTPNKSRLGANAIVGVSVAAARALAQSRGTPLWQFLNAQLAAGQALSAGGDAPSTTGPAVRPRLPVPHFNVVNGGVHAPNDLDFQEFMIAPMGASSLPEAVRAGAEIYGQLKRRLGEAGMGTGLGDEGGFAPQLGLPEEVLSMLVLSISAAGYTPGREGVAIALDPAASEFYRDGAYHVAGRALTSSEMIDWYEELVAAYPIWSIEDGLAEDDWDGWAELTERLGRRVQLVGDDLFVTDPATIAESISRGIANAALIKVNQIGTVTETLRALSVCSGGGYAAMISHRSGETEDSFIADLAVAAGTGQLKTGAPARGERIAKYNRLLQIAADHPDLPYGLPEPTPTTSPEAVTTTGPR